MPRHLTGQTGCHLTEGPIQDDNPRMGNTPEPFGLRPVDNRLLELPLTTAAPVTCRVLLVSAHREDRRPPPRISEVTAGSGSQGILCGKWRGLAAHTRRGFENPRCLADGSACVHPERVVLRRPTARDHSARPRDRLRRRGHVRRGEILGVCPPAVHARDFLRPTGPGVHPGTPSAPAPSRSCGGSLPLSPAGPRPRSGHRRRRPRDRGR